MTDNQYERLTEGEKRVRELSWRYGLPLETLLELWGQFKRKPKAEGFDPTLRAFEILLRVDLARNMQELRNLEPLYCKGLDPLNPYSPTKVRILSLVAIAIALIAPAAAWFR